MFDTQHNDLYKYVGYAYKNSIFSVLVSRS